MLSVGSGPGIIETNVQQIRKDLTFITLDHNSHMITAIPFFLQPVLADGAALPFQSNSFELVLCITSLEFMKNPKQTIKEIVQILKPDGILLSFMLNPDSHYVQQKMQTSNSYIGTHLKQQSLEKITKAVSHWFRSVISDHDLKKDIDKSFDESLRVKNQLKMLKAIK